MYIIRPTDIIDSMFVSSDVAETDHAEYAPATTYADGDHVIVTGSGVHKIYESLQNANTGHYPPDNPTWWLDSGSTNRWKPFDDKVQTQTSKSESMTWVLMPGVIDAISILNLDASEVDIIMANQDTDLVTNGDVWTGASGTTQPNNWDKVGTPTNFTIDGGALKITVAAPDEGISQTITVTPETEIQLLLKYRNTAGDIARFSVYDVTHSADILARTDLPSSTVDATGSYVFTVPAGCISIKIELIAKSGGDIVWFDKVSLSEVIYNKTIGLISTVAIEDWYTYFFEPIVRTIDIVKTDLAAIDLPPYSSASLQVIVTNSGGTAKCGEIIVGIKSQIGAMMSNPSIGIIDYSIKEADVFGNYTITERAYSKRMSCDVRVKNTIIDEIVRQLTECRATPLVWVGSELYSMMVIYGFYKSFEVVMPGYLLSECSLEIEGLT